MTAPSRFAAPVAAVLSLVLLAACASLAAPSSEPTGSAPPATATDVGARQAFSAAMCPILAAIVDLDPRFATMREAGAGGGDLTGHADELAALADDVGVILDELETVPEWNEGANVRYQLISGLHAIRARLLHAGDDLTASDAAASLAALPFLATEAMDIAFNKAALAGFSCEEES